MDDSDESRLYHMEWRSCFLTLYTAQITVRSWVGAFVVYGTRPACNILCILCFQQRARIRLEINSFGGYLIFLLLVFHNFMASDTLRCKWIPVICECDYCHSCTNPSLSGASIIYWVRQKD